MATEERTKEILKGLHEAVCQFEEEEAVKWANAALAEGVDPFVATMDGARTAHVCRCPLRRPWPPKTGH
jgi:methanogenic corrinoid protein MtbC1